MGRDFSLKMEPSSETRPPTYGETVTQNASTARLPLAALAGFVAALVGAALWAALAAATHFKIGFAAVGVGFLVGWAIRTVGQGHNSAYGYAGAALALLGCVVGDVLSDCVSAAAQFGQPVLAVVSHLTPTLAVELLKAGFQPLDALFYFIALRAGYRYAFIK